MARYINADEFNEKIIKITKTTSEKNDAFYVIGRIIYHLQTAQTEDVTPIIRGKWYDKKTTIKGAHGLAYGRWGCSVCKRKFSQKSNYCPNCGADMRGEE